MMMGEGGERADKTIWLREEGDVIQQHGGFAVKLAARGLLECAW